MEIHQFARFVQNGKIAQTAVNTIVSTEAAAVRVRDEFIRQLVRAKMPISIAADAFRKAYCMEALRSHGWNYSRAAIAIGMHRNSLARRVRPREIATKRRDYRRAKAQAETYNRRIEARTAPQGSVV